MGHPMMVALPSLIASFGLSGGHGVPVNAPCVRQTPLEQWLAQQSPRWEGRLSRERGYEKPEAPVVCRLRARRPYTDIERGQIYANALRDANDEVALIHEYLHLALRHHPRGKDEIYVEALARE